MPGKWICTQEVKISEKESLKVRESRRWGFIKNGSECFSGEPGFRSLNDWQHLKLMGAIFR